MTVPLLGDISLEYVQRIEHALQGGFVATPIAGLEGALQQRVARPSHQIHLEGVLFGEQASDALQSLQQAAAQGDELTFAADITSALELQRVVITAFRAAEVAGEPDRMTYALTLAESPPLPPPAELEPFGGLGDFGAGDLGFDSDVMGDLQDAAGEINAAVDEAMEAAEALDALAGLDGLNLGGFLSPLDERAGAASGLGEDFDAALRDLMEGFES